MIMKRVYACIYSVFYPIICAVFLICGSVPVYGEPGNILDYESVRIGVMDFRGQGPVELTSDPDTLRFPSIGEVMPRHASEIASSPWSVGGETMDRDYTIYDNWKEYLGPLGAKKIRLQAGWAKTEQEKGVYDFTWLDEIIDDVIDQGVEPWLQVSYGNPIYDGGGGARLGAGLPTSKEALQAWDEWVRAMATRYRGRVKIWEVWNEPSIGAENDVEDYARLFIRTAEIIREEIPEATIYALSLCCPSRVEYVDAFLSYLEERHKLHLVDEVTYHGYVANPDDSYKTNADSTSEAMVWLRPTIRKYSDRITIRQGEQGVPSTANSSGALSEHPWTELKQAKWVLRRMLGDLGHDVPSLVFQMMDMLYAGGEDTNTMSGWARYGLLRANEDKTVAYRKPSYFAVQHLTAIFDNSLSRIRNYPYTARTDSSLSVFAYRKEHTDEQVVTLWIDSSIPSNSNEKSLVDFSFSRGQFTDPVYVDLRKGTVYSIPDDQWHRNGTEYRFKGIPVYDSPILIADRSTIPLKQPNGASE